MSIASAELYAAAVAALFAHEFETSKYAKEALTVQYTAELVLFYKYVTFLALGLRAKLDYRLSPGRIACRDSTLTGIGRPPYGSCTSFAAFSRYDHI